VPVPEGTKFRIKKTKKGYQRLAFHKGKVIEATPMKKNKKGKLKAVAHKQKCLGKK
jgi:hypothetical protein